MIGPVHFQRGSYTLLPDALLVAAVEAGLRRADILVYLLLLNKVSSAGEMRPIPVETIVFLSAGALSKDQVSKALSHLRNKGLIEPMRRLHGRQIVQDRSNINHVCSYAVPIKLWDTVRQCAPVPRGEQTQVDRNGVIRTVCGRPMYEKGSYTAVPHALLTGACKAGTGMRATFALLFLARRIYENGRLGSLQPERIWFDYGFSRSYLRAGLEELLEAGLILSLSADLYSGYQLSSSLWGMIAVDDDWVVRQLIAAGMN